MEFLYLIATRLVEPLVEFKSFNSEIQDTQVDILHQDVSVHKASALSDHLGVSTSMDVDVDSVEADLNAGASLGVPSLDPYGQTVPACVCHFCVS